MLKNASYILKKKQNQTSTKKGKKSQPAGVETETFDV